MSYTDRTVKSRFLLVPAILSAFALLAGTLAPAHGATQGPVDHGPAGSSTATVEAQAEGLARVEEYFTKDEISNLQTIGAHINSNGQLDYAAAADDPKIDEAFVEDFAEGYALGTDLETSDAAVIDGAQLQSAAATSSNCNGINARIGSTVWLDSCRASALSGAMAVGAPASTLAGIIIAATGVSWIPAGILAASLALYGGLASLCNSWGRGVIMSTSAPACWSQPGA